MDDRSDDLRQLPAAPAPTREDGHSEVPRRTSPLRYSPAGVVMRIRGPVVNRTQQLVLGFVVLAWLALVVILIWFYSRWVLLIISTVYVSHGVLAKLWSLVKPRRVGTGHPEIELDRKPSPEVRS